MNNGLVKHDRVPPLALFSIVSLMGTSLDGPNNVHKLELMHFKIECYGPVIKLMASPSKSMTSPSHFMEKLVISGLWYQEYKPGVTGPWNGFHC